MGALWNTFLIEAAMDLSFERWVECGYMETVVGKTFSGEGMAWAQRTSESPERASLFYQPQSTLDLWSFEVSMTTGDCYILKAPRIEVNSWKLSR